jgi:hypothetical protein
VAAPSRITLETVQHELPNAESRAHLLRAIGVTASRPNCLRLERLAELHDLALPPVGSRGRSGTRPSRRTSPVWERERLEAALVGAESMLDVLANLGLGRTPGRC